MSTTETEAPFEGKDANVACPNCGRPLFSGLANGNILVCRAEDGTGCQVAVDPSNLDGATMATMAVRMEDVVPSPEVGPPNENEPQVESDPDIQAAASQAWEPPTSAPQAQNFDPDAEVVETVLPTRATTTTTPVVTTPTGDGSGGDSTT